MTSEDVRWIKTKRWQREIRAEKKSEMKRAMAAVRMTVRVATAERNKRREGVDDTVANKAAVVTSCRAGEE